MTIVFLCGSLEPGCDGVGDYVRRLAVQLLKQGHKAGAIALDDQYIVQEVQTIQNIEAVNLALLRIPSWWPASQRFGSAQQWINNFDAEWLSLQFVPFSFHPKGLPFGLAKHLTRLGQGRLWHLMFHELWAGMEKDSTLKQALLGLTQKLLIENLIKTIKPRIIHTQARLYQAYLSQLGFSVNYLPLFANIPVTTAITRKPFEPNWTQSYDKPTAGLISFVAFGSIQPGSLIKQLAKEVCLHSNKEEVLFSLTVMGRSGSQLSQFADAWQSEGLPITLLGEQPAERISEVLDNSTIGLSTNPTVLAEKSGTIAAMREHRLPVLCISRPWYPRKYVSIEAESGITDYNYGQLAKYLENAHPIESHTNLYIVAKDLVNALLTAS